MLFLGYRFIAMVSSVRIPIGEYGSSIRITKQSAVNLSAYPLRFMNGSPLSSEVKTNTDQMLS